jgi:hypothetical protein
MVAVSAVEIGQRGDNKTDLLFALSRGDAVDILGDFVVALCRWEGGERVCEGWQGGDVGCLLGGSAVLTRHCVVGGSGRTGSGSAGSGSASSSYSGR